MKSIIGMIVWFILGVIVFSLSIWLYQYADCERVIKKYNLEVPGRCLK